MRGIGFLVLIVAAAAMPSPLRAQCRLCETPSITAAPATATDDVRLEIETDLDFDRLIVGGANGGDATLRPDGSGLATGSVEIGPRTKVATVIVHGQPGRALRIDIPQRIDLFSLSGTKLTFDNTVSDAGDLPRLDAAGNLTFHIGGRLRFGGAEDGDYRGDLPVTVEYL